MRALHIALLCGLAAAPAVAADAPEPTAVDVVPVGPSPQERLAEIRRLVQAAVTYPQRARELGIEGIARIQFVIGPDGLAREVQTVQSSGHRVLDRAAEEGAVAAGRLPPLFGRIRIPVRFDLRDSGRR